MGHTAGNKHKIASLFMARQNGRHFEDYIFKRIILNKNVWISIKISLKFVTKVSINNIGDKPLSEPMMVRLPTHIYASLGLNELIITVHPGLVSNQFQEIGIFDNLLDVRDF